MSNNLANVGLGIGGLLLAKRAGDVIADKENTLYKTTVTQKLINTYDDMTKHENHVIGKWNGFAFWSKSNFVRLNATFQKLIDKNSQAESGVISKQTKTDFLHDAKQSMMSAVRIDQFIQILLNNSPNSNKVKSYCDELRLFYLKKRELNNALLSKEISNEDVLSKQKELELVNNLIMNTTKLFSGKVVELFNVKNVDNDNNAYDAFKPFRHLFRDLKISNTGNNDLEQFINVYNLKVGLRSDNDEKFKPALYQDISSYIFAKSTGSLAAKGFISERYGSFVADILDNSFIGDPDSNNRGLLSEYFMQTVYSLLNDGSKGFSLSKLCLGSPSNVNSNQNQPQVTLPRDNDKRPSIDLFEHTNSYVLNSTGILVLENTLNYYGSMSTIHKNLTMKDSDFKMLLWNLTGGNNLALNKYKRGLFFHIDNQLKNFDNKIHGRNSIANYYKKTMEEREKKAISVLMQGQSWESNITPPNLKDFFTLSKQKAYLSELSDTEFFRRQMGEERRPRYVKVDIDKDLKLISESAGNINNRKKLLEYAKVCFDDGYHRKLDKIFDGLNIIRNNNDISIDVSSQSKRILESESFETTKLDDTSIKQLVSLEFVEYDNNFTRYVNSYNEEYQSKLSSHNLDIFSGNQSDKLDEYLKQYSTKLEEFKNAVQDSEIFKDLSSILTNLDNFKTFLIFYDEIKGNPSRLSGLNKVTDIYTRINLHNNALQFTKEYVKNIITLHTNLEKKFKDPTAKLTNQEQQVFIILSTLFEFVDSSENQSLAKFILSYDNTQTPNTELTLLFNEIPEEVQQRYLDGNIINYMQKREFRTVRPKRKDTNNLGTIYFDKIVDKFAEGIGSIRLINQSFNTLQILLKDRLYDKLQTKLYIVNLFAKLAGEELRPNTLKTIKDNIAKIRESNCTIDGANKIYNCTDYIMKIILTNKRDDNALSSINKDIPSQENIAKLYNDLKGVQFSSNLDSVPALYQHILRTVLDNTKEPSKIKIALRFFVAIVTSKENIISGEDDNEQYRGIKDILDNGDKLRRIDVIAFLNTFQAHETLLEAFGKLFNALNSQDAIPYLLIYEEIVSAASNNLVINENKVADINFKVKLIFDELFQTIGEQDLKIDNRESARTVSFRDKSIVAESLLDKLKEIVTKSLNEKNISENNLENNSDMIKGIDELYDLKRGLERSFANSVKRIKDLMGTFKTSTEKYSILTGEELSAINDLIFNYTTKETNNKVVRSIILNSDLLKPYLEHFNRMLVIYNNEETIKKNYQGQIRAEFDGLYTEINQAGFNDEKIEFFKISSQSKITDEEEFQGVVNQIKTNSIPDESINNMLERLSNGNKTPDFYKQCINMYNYNLLKRKFSEFYIQNFYKTDKFLECYKRLTDNMNHDLVDARVSKPTAPKNFALYTKFEKYLAGYDEYQTEYQQAFSDFMAASDESSAITLAAVKRHFKHDEIMAQNHLHVSKFNSLEIIIRNLIKNKTQDIPILRRSNYVAGIIIYFKDKLAKNEQDQYNLNKLNALNNNDPKSILDVEKKLLEFLDNYLNISNSPGIIRKLYLAIKKILDQFKLGESLADDVTEDDIINSLEDVWKEIISDLHEDTFNLTEQVKNVSTVAIEMSCLNKDLCIVKQKCPCFYNDLEAFCKDHETEKIIFESVEHKSQELIKEYVHEFSTLAEGDPDNFKKICSIKFMNKAINSILNSKKTEASNNISKFKEYLLITNTKQQLENDIGQGKLKSAISKYQKSNLDKKDSPLIIKFNNNEYKFTNDELIIHLGFTAASAKYKYLEIIFNYKTVARIDEQDATVYSNPFQLAATFEGAVCLVNVKDKKDELHLRDDNTYVLLQPDDSLLQIDYGANDLRLIKYAHVSLPSKSPLNDNEEELLSGLSQMNYAAQDLKPVKSDVSLPSPFPLEDDEAISFEAISLSIEMKSLIINNQLQKEMVAQASKRALDIDGAIESNQLIFAGPRQLIGLMSTKLHMSVAVFCAENLYILSKEGKLQFINKQGDLQDADYNGDEEMLKFILKRSPARFDFNEHLNKIAKQLVEEIETIQISKEKLSDAYVDWADCEKII